MIKSFAPLKISFTLKGGFTMDYKIVEKEAFTVIGAQKKFKYDDAKTEIPKFWTEHYQSGKGSIVCGMYGVNMDESMGDKEFEYLIADDYNGRAEIPEGFVTKVIPSYTWAVFLVEEQCQKQCRRLIKKYFPNGYQTVKSMNLRQDIVSKCMVMPLSTKME